MTTTIVSVLPLTTTFTPTSCAASDGAISSYDESTSTLASGLSVWYTWSGFEGTEGAQCYPTGWNTISYYSPGLCPDGYSMDQTMESTTGTLTTTFGTCCFK